MVFFAWKAEIVRPRHHWLLFTFVALGLAAGTNGRSSAAEDFTWLVTQNESGISLSYAIPETDISLYDFTCQKTLVDLSYDMVSKQDVPYGTEMKIGVKLTIGKATRTVPATAIFNEAGSPLIVVHLGKGAAVMRSLLAGGVIATRDRWGHGSADAPPHQMIDEFAKKCGFAPWL